MSVLLLRHQQRQRRDPATTIKLPLTPTAQKFKKKHTQKIAHDGRHR